MLSMAHISLRRFPDRFNTSLNLDEHNEMKELAWLRVKRPVSHGWNPGDYYLPTVWCQTSYLTFLCLGFICKMVIITMTSLECVEYELR